MDIVCKRIEGEATANVDHKWKKHSPTGFEWGYGGSGPADLALNILLVFVGREEAESLHQQFKEDFIARMPHEGDVILEANIREWLSLHQRKKEHDDSVQD